MKIFFKSFKNRIVAFFGLFLFFSLIPYLVSYLIAPSINRYYVDFTYDDTVEISNLITYENLSIVKDEIIDYRNEQIENGDCNIISDFSYVDLDDLLDDNIKIEETNDYYEISVIENSFNSKAQAKRFLKGVISNSNVIGETSYTYILDSVIAIQTNLSVFKVLSISIIISFLIFSILFILLYKYAPKFYEKKYKYDNLNLYRSFFHKSYWKNQFRWLKNIRDLSIISILFALMLALEAVNIPSGFSTLGIGITYLVFALISLIYGPLTGLVIGFLSDIISFFLFPTGYVFHFGYTLNAMLSGFIYGICFYKTNITFTKCLFSRIVVNLLINVVLGSIWWSQISDFTYSQFQTYMLFTSLPKNLVYLVPQSLVLFVFLKFILKPISISNIISKEQSNSFSII